MNTTNLIRDLQRLVEQHGDLPVTLAISTYEYAIGTTGHANSGPLPNLGELQKQADLPERIVIEGKMQGCGLTKTVQRWKISNFAQHEIRTSRRLAHVSYVRSKVFK